ncbi:glycosyltransferase family 4 protein [Patescibacteria group bacterium]|nr:glycosyltransferase family 4 protein [Patescibacteria group bacterium]
MKIAFIGQKGLPAKQGGVEKHVHELAVRLANNGHDVFAYSRKSYTNTDNTTFQGVTLKYLPSIATKNFDAISHSLLAALDVLRQDYDIVHFHGVGPSLVSFIPRLLKRRTKVVATFHCRDQFHQKWGMIARAFLSFGEYAINKFPHKTIAVSKILRQYCSEKYGSEAAYVPNGCAITDTDKASMLPLFNIKKGKYILAVSRLVKHKGLHYLIDAFKELNDPELKLVIVGDTSYTDEYVSLLKERAQGDNRIVFAGLQTGEALAQLFKNARLYVHPSEAEGLPITVLEALKYGIPSIVSNIPENIEASGGYIYVFKNKEPLDLAKKMKLVLDHPNEVSELAKAGQKYVSITYDWDRITETIESIYEDLLEDVREDVAYEREVPLVR